jgi:hypothetical protein
MKKELLKKLLILIVMMFSISYLSAQCHANKVQFCKTLRSGGCAFKCVSPGQVQKYINQGWGYFCNCSFPLGKMEKSPVIITDKTRDSKTKQVGVKK